jgi:Tfp pilus assembly protein PilO
MVLKTREKFFIGAAVLIGVVMGFDQLVTTPQKKEAAAIQKQVQEANEKIASVTVSLAGLSPVRKRVEEKRKEKETFFGRITDERQLEFLLDQLGKESRTKQIELIQLGIKEEASGSQTEDKDRPRAGAFKKVSIDVELTAGYGMIGPCLDSIQSLPIFLEVEQVSISRKEESFPKLQVTLKKSLYVSPSARKGLQGKAGG